jgi:hypothetical protein
MLDTYAKLVGLGTVEKVWRGASVTISASLFQMDSIAEGQGPRIGRSHPLAPLQHPLLSVGSEQTLALSLKKRHETRRAGSLDT